jgi:hypothetical protein
MACQTDSVAWIKTIGTQKSDLGWGGLHCMHRAAVEFIHEKMDSTTTLLTSVLAHELTHVLC